ncbi:MAG TPA: hypothetical protein EYO90_04385, partial [Candidatus Latescibacteria bacterium]|nr:hypothetical protein [Candidatus Latescibacterota bacterium]
MSKLIERLEKVGTVTPIPMGFGANRAVEKSPAMLLVVLSGTNSTESTSQIEAHSYITSAGKITKAALKAAKGQAGDAIWGLWPETITNDSLNALKGEGGDFFILSTVDAPAEALAVEDLGRLITVPADLPEELGHSLEEIPVDAVILVGLEDASPLSVRDLMQVRSMRDLISKPLLLLRSRALNQGELVVLQDVGVQGIVLDMRTMKEEDAAQVRKDMEELPPRKIKRDQPGALLPRLSSRTASPQQEQEEEEEEEYD